ncbi:hypothetical protein AB0C96_42150 [Streptomyces sp. NPDC048506]|uniref:hypothetical protein n=1 Tax=Streptomyces sp. NPDC048506 TaxID=3155028 RepID=UPI003447B1DB
MAGDARAVVAEVLADAPGDGGGPVCGDGGGLDGVAPGRGVGVEVLAPEYQRILAVFALPEAADGLRVKPIAVRLGWGTTPARIEGCACG